MKKSIKILLKKEDLMKNHERAYWPKPMVQIDKKKEANKRACR